MMQLLVLKERVKTFYQKYDLYLTPVIKFVFTLFVFISINSEIGYDARLTRWPVVLILSLLCAFTPSSIMVLLAALVSTLHVFSISPILSIIILFVFLILYLLFIKYTPEYGYVLLAIPILYSFNLPYIVPILMGLIATPVVIISTSSGVIIYYLFQIIKSAVTMQVNMTVEDILQLYTYVIDSLTKNKDMISTIVIFVIITLVVYFVRKMSFAYAFETSIIAGALSGILGFLICNLALDSSIRIFSMILGMLISTAIVYVIHFFDLTLDYSAVEYTQFQDDEYYYYVKAVPKAIVTSPQKHVKHINPKKELEDRREDYNRDDFIDDYYRDEFEDEEDY